MTPSTTVRSPLRLYGRDDELATLEGLLDSLRRGDGGALVLAAPPGLGRTALLRAAGEAHRGRGPVLYATAAPAERAVPYSGLGALLGPAPAPATALSASPPSASPTPGITPDALVGRLRELAAGRPLLVCADDAHAWDRASRAALAFAARRLGAGSGIAALLSAADGTAFAGLPTLHLGPLDEGAASALLDRLTRGTEGLDPVVRAELLREAAGNPRLLAGLTGRLTPDQLAGRTPLPLPLPGSEAVLAAHAERLDGLPDRARTLVLLAAAAQEHEPDGAGADALLLLRAGTRAGLPRAFLDRALFDGTGTDGLLQRAGSRVHFAHRLVARAVLHLAPWTHRRTAHELLATLLTESGDRVLRGASDGLGASGGLAASEAPEVLAGPGVAEVPAGPEAWGVPGPDAPEARDAPGASGASPAPDVPEAPTAWGAPEAPGASDAPAASAARTARPPTAPPPLGPAVPARPPLPLAALVQRACAAPGPDAVLAARLEAAATDPACPHAERSAALARAALLSTEPALRAARFAAAAEQAGLAGDPSLARALLARTGPRTADPDPVAEPGVAGLMTGPGAAGPGAEPGAVGPDPVTEPSVAGPVTEPGAVGPAAGPSRSSPGTEPGAVGPVTEPGVTGPAAAPRMAGPAAGPAPGLAVYVHGMLALRSGPVADAHEALLAAAGLLAPGDPRRALDALLGAAEAAWAAGDALGYLDAMNRLAPTPVDGNLEHYRAGMSAVLEGRTAEGHALLRRCLGPAGDPVGDRSGDPAEDPRAPAADPAGDRTADSPANLAEALRARAADLADAPAKVPRAPAADPADAPRAPAAGSAEAPRARATGLADTPAGHPRAPATLLRAGVAALVLGDVVAACRAGARALAVVRTRGPDALLPQALEHLAYAELRAGRHAGARAHALEGLHAARRTGQPNSSAHLHAVLALAASVEGPAEACAAHADAALAGAGPHGLAQAATLATWARARADLAAGRPGEAAARLA
ncbi:AAA family ATPase, partial [Streptomyces sp. NPDC058375]|uniref:AAA family ATPase n=1 Tax=Streptomyces sp. NPDC058375 TaxID=3346467 RepID=UPI00365055E0